MEKMLHGFEHKLREDFDEFVKEVALDIKQLEKAIEDCDISNRNDLYLKMDVTYKFKILI